MIEREVHHGVHALRSASQAIQVFQIPAMHLGAGRLQLLRSGVTACQSAHLVPCFNEFLYQFCPNKSCSARHKNSHRPSPFCLPAPPTKALRQE